MCISVFRYYKETSAGANALELAILYFLSRAPVSIEATLKEKTSLRKLISSSKDFKGTSHSNSVLKCTDSTSLKRKGSATVSYTHLRAHET